MYGLLLCKNKKYIVRKIGLRYDSRIVASNENRTLLLDIAKNLNLGFPKVTVNFINLQNNNPEGIISWLMEENINSSIIQPHKERLNDLPVNSINSDDERVIVQENNDIQNNDPGSTMTWLMEEDINSSIILPHERMSNDLPVNSINLDNEAVIVQENSDMQNFGNIIDVTRSMEEKGTSDLKDLSSNTDSNNDDPDYCEESDISSEDNYNMSTRKSGSFNENKNNSFETSLNASGSKICDDVNLHITKAGGITKRNFCYYCKTMQSKIARHLEYVHKDEEEIKKFSLLPKGNKERQQIISLLRRKGNYVFNTDKTYNKGELLVCRRPSEFKNKTACDFTCCAKCKGFFTKNNIRHHFRICTNKTFGKCVKILGRKVQGRIHETANTTLRNIVFPVLREDNITRIIRYDELLIVYGNKLCTKYRHQHQQDMIRSRLRVLGRFIIALRKINNNVTDFFSIYQPKVYDDCITAINQVAGYNTDTKLYATPSVASRLGTLIKQIGNIAIAEYIKKDRLEKKTEVENFLKLQQEDYGTSINKTVEESTLQVKRYKKQDLPLADDINKLHNYLLRNRNIAFQELNNAFKYEVWHNLASFTLVSIQLFNRRRAGEIERISIEDYKHYQIISADTYPEFYKSLSQESRMIANKYTRFYIRGKLGRSVPVLLDQDMKASIDRIIYFRKQAHIPDGNPYIFGLPGYDQKRYKYMRACQLLRKYSTECGAKMPLSLRGTKLRKHIATRCITLNLSEQDVTDLANHLGHERNIHMQHYRQPIPEIEIIKISRLLEMAQGEDENIDNEENEDDEEGFNTQAEKVLTIEELEPHQSSVDNFSCITTPTSNISYKGKKRSTSPYGPTKRVKWSQEEYDAIFAMFGREIKEKRLPSGQQLAEAKAKYNCLYHRTIPQIRSWIHNLISKKTKQRNGNN